MYITVCMYVLVTAALAGNLVKVDVLELGSTPEEPAVPLTPDDPEPQPVDPDQTEKLAAAMDDFHATADIAEKRPDAQDSAKMMELHLRMVEALDEILDLLDNTDAAYYFLSAHGFDTIIAPHLRIVYAPLRGRLLQLIKALFDIAPTTKAQVPSRIFDELIDIFEADENASVKAQVIELLSIWLPENPQAQARVMKMKGLKPFYAQLSKLDTPAIAAILELFSRIVREHEAARVNRIQKSKADYVALRLYQQIGLIEQISTPEVCNGLLNVLTEMWAVSKAEREVLPALLGLLRTIRPHCSAVYRGREQAAVLLKQMAKFVENPANKDYFEQLHTNISELTEFFNDFIVQVTVVQRDEL